jgi:Family of unknown function (DUF6504)
MRGIRGEPVEVWLRNERPARFVWRGRLHTVIFVLDRQVTPAAPPADVDPATGGTASSETASSATGGSECWRVEATPARSVPPATYELCRDLASGRWLLSRA